MKKIFLFLLYVSLLTDILAIEVGGHLTENTTWHPENNPHLVTAGVYVEEGVTLTILPGTIVKFNSVYYDDWGHDQFYFNNNEEPIAKFIRVDGQIIAEGTDQDSISFTRIQDEEFFHWGTIYLSEGSPTSSFKHCSFKYSAFTGFSLWEQPRAAISAWNGSLNIDKCSFIDNDHSIYLRNNIIDVCIMNSYFSNVEYSHPNNMNVYGIFIGIHYILNENISSPLIVGNTFRHGQALSSSKTVYFVNNDIHNVIFNRLAVNVQDDIGINYYYGNTIGSCSEGIRSHGDTQNESFNYIKENYFDINGGDGINLNYVLSEIVDNFFNDCKIVNEFSNSSKILNNIIMNTSGDAISSNSDFITNNIIFNCDNGLSGRGSSQFTNNLFVNNESAFSFFTDNHIIENTIIINNENYLEDPDNPDIYGNPIFRNCILDFELPEECTDGGGNIWVDSLQVQQIFEDIQNNNFHLIDSSIAIDVGFDTLDYYYPFDMDFNHRIWDGDSNGSAIIDIGPYEYGAPSLGGIEGITYDTTTGNPVNYVLLKINNIPGEFTFSDNIGNFEYRLPEGIYDVYTERVFYDDVIEYEVEVVDGEITYIEIPMFETLDSEEVVITPQYSKITLSNYPNPFNPRTSIEFELNERNFTNLIVFNVKGQKVQTIISEILNPGNYSYVWNGRDENNNHSPSGIYFCKLSSGTQNITRKMILLK